MTNYSLIPIRWTHALDKKGDKTIFLNIHKGEKITTWLRKRRMKIDFKRWFKRFFEEPLVFYKLGYNKFNVTKDGKTLCNKHSKMAIVSKTMQNHKVFQTFVIWHLINKLKQQDVQTAE